MTTREFAELHVHTGYSLLDGVDTPAALVEQAVGLGLGALAVTDHDSLAAVPAFAKAAGAAGLPTVFGAELNLGLTEPRTGTADPAGHHLLVLARNPAGYRSLSHAIANAHLAGGAKGRPVYDLSVLAEASAGNWEILTGCRKGHLGTALERGGIAAAETELRRLIELFGTQHVHVELTRHDAPGDDPRLDALAELAARTGLPLLATSAVHYARPASWTTFAALAAIRSRRTLDEVDAWLPAGPAAFLHSPDEMARRFAAWPAAVTHAAELAREAAIDFDTQLRPGPPTFPVPDGHTQDSWLRHMVRAGMHRRYGTRARRPDAWRAAEAELEVVTKLGFAGFFVIAAEVCRFCRDRGIIAQGRGSAANSVIVFALGVSQVDPLKYGLLFERFLHEGRSSPPDIDIDVQASRREEVLQHLYSTFGRTRCAMVANEIVMQPRLAVREAARVLGHSAGAVDAIAAHTDSHAALPPESDDVPTAVLELAHRLWDGGTRVRHLGIHSGGVVLGEGPIADVLPVEWATMPGRTVIQADKESLAAAGLYKTDVLSLRALDVVADVFAMVEERDGVRMELADVPADDPAIYDLINAGDGIGLFQLESRAQLGLAPQFKARSFQDVAIQIALIRPGPGASGASRRFLERRGGREPVPRIHPIVDGILERTLGVVVFQESVMDIAISAAGFDPTSADQLRKAMGSKRSTAEFEALRERFFAGLAVNGIIGPVAESIWDQIAAFSGYSFPFSHSLSFAFIALATAWIKKYEPAAMLASMLNRQPMGFWAPATLIEDARRHHVTVLPVCVNASAADAVLESLTEQIAAAYRPTHPHAAPRPQAPVRLGLAGVRGIGEDLAAEIVAERDADGPFTDVEDLARRTGAPLSALEALTMAGALDGFGLGRRETLWAVGAAAGSRRDHLPGTAPGTAAPPLPTQSVEEQTLTELWAGQHSRHHPVALARDRLTAAGVTAGQDLDELRDGQLVRVAGLITHRQRPPTAGGTCFLNLEDETANINVIVPAATWQACTRRIQQAPALLVHGTVQRRDGALHILAGRLQQLSLAAPDRSRSYR